METNVWSTKRSAVENEFWNSFNKCNICGYNLANSKKRRVRIDKTKAHSWTNTENYNVYHKRCTNPHAGIDEKDDNGMN